MHGHAQQVDHNGHHDESAAHSHDGRQRAHQRPEQEWHQRGDRHLGPGKVNLERKRPDQTPIDRRSWGSSPGRAPPQRDQAFEEHVGTDAPEHQHIDHRDGKIGLPQTAQNRTRRRPQSGWNPKPPLPWAGSRTSSATASSENRRPRQTGLTGTPPIRPGQSSRIR